MSRLDIERQQKLEPERIKYAKYQIELLGYEVELCGKMIKFNKDGNEIRFFPYSGWATGKGIKDSRGLKNLLNQL